MERKGINSRLPHNWKEEIPDYIIDLSKIQYKKKRKLVGDGSILKLFVEDGKGTEAKFGATVYFNIEARYKDGTLWNPRADRKGVNKITLKGEDENKAFEIALTNSKFGESFWCKFTGKLLLSLKFFKELPADAVPDGCDTKELWCKFFILRIKHSPKKIFCDFSSLTNCLEESKTVAKEYIELAKVDEDLYDYAIELYKFWINILKNLTKQIKKEMTSENHKEKDNLIVALYLNIAFIYIKKEHYILAKEASEAALELDPNNIKGLFRLAQACINNDSLDEKTYNCLKICFEREPNNPSFVEYLDWYRKYKQKRSDKRAKQDQWKVYKKLLEDDELEIKKKRKRERVGEEIKEVKDTNQDSGKNLGYIQDYEEFEGTAKEWQEAIKEEEEERAREKLEAKIEKNESEQSK